MCRWRLLFRRQALKHSLRVSLPTAISHHNTHNNTLLSLSRLNSIINHRSVFQLKNKIIINLLPTRHKTNIFMSCPWRLCNPNYTHVDVQVVMCNLWKVKVDISSGQQWTTTPMLDTNAKPNGFFVLAHSASRVIHLFDCWNMHILIRIAHFLTSNFRHVEMHRNIFSIIICPRSVFCARRARLFYSARGWCNI